MNKPSFYRRVTCLEAATYDLEDDMNILVSNVLAHARPSSKGELTELLDTLREARETLMTFSNQIQLVRELEREYRKKERTKA